MVETWNERMRRLEAQHRAYPTLEEGDPEADRQAAKHLADIWYAARCAEVSFGEMVARLDAATNQG